MKRKGIIFNYYIASADNGNRKITVFLCKFCNKAYALHATRMGKHLLSCLNCSDEVKNVIKKEINHTKSRSTTTVPVFSTPKETEEENETNSTISATSFSGHLLPFCDSLTNNENEVIWAKLAKAIYATGTPLNITENAYWIDVFKTLRPSLPLPSRFVLSNSLLNQIYNDVEISVKSHIENAEFIGIQCDVLTNSRNESIMNFIITTPKPVFYKTLTTDDNRPTDEYICNKLSEIFGTVGINRIVGCVTDNSRYMIKATQLLEEKYCEYPISYYGCAAHILNLLIQDLVKLKSVTVVVNSAKSVINSIKEKTILSVLFQRIQNEKLSSNEKCSLKLPVSTRWASVVICLEDLKKNKHVLQTLAISNNANELSRIDRANILDEEEFWSKIDKIILLLEPIKKWIVILQSNESKISEVAEAFFELQVHFEQQIFNCTVFQNDENEPNLLEALKYRKKMCLKSIHFATNLLDPKYKGTNLNNNERTEGIEYIYKFANILYEEQIDEIIKNIAEYRANTGFFAINFVKSSMKNTKISAINFWSGICVDLPLSKVAQAVLSMQPTSASIERSFSSQEFALSKNRNKLPQPRTEKLTYIHHNLNLLTESANDNTAEEIDSSDGDEILNKNEVKIEDDSEVDETENLFYT